MDESEPEPIPEKPRFLLPDGCKDLYDVLRRRESEQRLKSPAPLEVSLPPAGSFTQSKFPAAFPSQVVLPDPVSVRDLAAAIHVPPYHIIGVLMGWNVFASMNQPLSFSTAKQLCTLYGVEASRAD